ncbi:hypothetical protein D3C80_1942470 [compost metagenome]
MTKIIVHILQIIHVTDNDRGRGIYLHIIMGDQNFEMLPIVEPGHGVMSNPVFQILLVFQSVLSRSDNSLNS